jgi:hypothetical protein
MSAFNLKKKKTQAEEDDLEKEYKLKMWPSLQAHIWVWSTVFNPKK